MKSGKGNRHAQRKNYRRNNKGVAKQEYEYELIDGNWSDRPVAYCTYYKGYLTQNQAVRHNCIARKCPHYHIFGSEKVPVIAELPQYPLT